MADDKPFEATQSRVDKAKREGDVARSQEPGNVLAFAAAAVASTFAVPPIAAGAQSALRAAAGGRIDTPAIAACVAWMLVPAGCALAAATCAAALQGGVRLVPLRVKPERLSPVENLKRMFSREAAVTGARATIAFACAAAALVPAFYAICGSALHAGTIPAMAQAAWHGAQRAAAAAFLVGLAFAWADYALQFARWRKRLRMSFDELRRDQKEQDGDPAARSRRRSAHRRIARGSLQLVKNAAFVVTNPTHLAIALEYSPPAVAVPRVLVRASDEAAARVRELAHACHIPIVENVALARELYASAHVGEYIPQETYVAVAEIVAALAKAGA